MGFSIIYDTEAEVPEDLKEVAREADGKFIISKLPDGWEPAAHIKGYTDTLQKVRDDANKAQKVLNGFGEITPTQAKNAIKRLAEIAADDPEGKIKAAVAEREAQLIQTHETEKSELVEKVDFWKGFSTKSVVTQSVDAAIEEHKGNKTLLRPVVSRYVKAEEVDGKLSTVVVDEEGVTRIGGVKNGASVPMTVSQLVKELKDREDLAPAFSASGSSGTGANGSPGSAKNLGTLANLSPSARLHAIRAAGG